MDKNKYRHEALENTQQPWYFEEEFFKNTDKEFSE